MRKYALILIGIMLMSTPLMVHASDNIGVPVTMDATDLESPSPSASPAPVAPVPTKSFSPTVSSNSDEKQEEPESSGAEVKIQEEMVVPIPIPVKQNTPVKEYENSTIVVEISTVQDNQNVKKIAENNITKKPIFTSSKKPEPEDNEQTIKPTINPTKKVVEPAEKEIIKQPSEKKQNSFITTIKYVVIIAIVVVLIGGAVIALKKYGPKK